MTDPTVVIDLDAEVKTIPVDASRPVITTGGRLYGWSVRETSGAATAQVDIYDGGGTDGQLIATLPLVAGGGSTLSIGWPGLTCMQGIYVSVTSGAVTGAIWARA